MRSMLWRPARRPWRSPRCFCSPITARSSCAATFFRAVSTCAQASPAGTSTVQLSLARNDLALYVRKQFENLFPDGADLGDLPKFVDLALDKNGPFFSRRKLEGFFADGQARVSQWPSHQESIFPQFPANRPFPEPPRQPIADKSYALNKALH